MADDAPKIEIFGDSPTTEDGLGFDDYADILLGMIWNFDARSPLTIGIHGRWGSGKTSLMRMVEAKFEDDKKVKTIWFNAWAYGRDEPIGLALLQQILIEFQKEDGLKEKGKTLLRNVVKLGTDAVLRKITTITLEEAKEIFENSIGIKSTLRRDFEVAIGECLQDGGRLVVFIDDLDRCLPEKTIEILEVIKLFLDVPKCIFVIGVEKEAIERGIEVRYKSKEQKIPISGQDYIEKIIQIPFVLPPIREDDMAAFIENLGIGKREKGYVKIVAKGTGCNPRKVKMFLNVLRIRLAIAERTGGEIKPDLSAKLFVFEYVFQEFYKDLVKYKDQDILCKLERLASGYVGEELEELKSSDILKKYHEDGDLGSVLRDEPFFCGIDIEPYIYLSGTEASQEVMVFDESVLNELLGWDYVKMRHAVNIINKMPDSEKQQFLNVVISKLKDKDVSVRRAAADALKGIGDSRAVEALIEALKDKDVSVRRNAAWALYEIGDAGSVEALMGALKDTDTAVRVHAARTLSGLGDVSTVEALKEALKDADAEVRGDAAWGLGRIADAGSVEALIEALKGEEDADVRRVATDALGAIGDARAVEVLEEALNDEDEDVRMSAAGALSCMSDPRAVEALIEALKEGAVEVRRSAAGVLGHTGDVRAVEALEKALKDEDEDVRMSAALSLSGISDPRAVEVLIEALKDGAVNMRRSAAWALGDIGDAKSVEALKEALIDKDVNVREGATWALEQIKAKQNQ